MADRFLVFGDIHGEWDKLESLLAQVQPDDEQDEIVFLGDYVDRGPEPKRVLDYIMGLPRSNNIHMLQGNHELMLWNGFDEFWNAYNQMGGYVEGLDLWMQNGGYVTFQQISESVEEFEKYAKFVHSLPLYYQAKLNGHNYLFCHAGIDPNFPLEKQTINDFVWERRLAERYVRHSKMKYIKALKAEEELTVVVGHTPVPTMEPGRYTPIITPEVIFLDTGSFIPDGRISCMDLISGQVWQSKGKLER